MRDGGGARADDDALPLNLDGGVDGALVRSNDYIYDKLFGDRLHELRSPAALLALDVEEFAEEVV